MVIWIAKKTNSDKNHTMNSFGKDEIGNPYGAKISSSISPRNFFSRSSRRFSSQDTFDYPEFACPFAVDKDDITDPPSGPEPFDGKGHLVEIGGLLRVTKSQDAAVGALVKMLSTAPPCRQDFSSSIKLLGVSKPEIWRTSTQEPDGRLESGTGGIQDPAFDTNITASGLQLLKTTAEALEEFRSYREMKESLLRKASGFQTSKCEKGF